MKYILVECSTDFCGEDHEFVAIVDGLSDETIKSTCNIEAYENALQYYDPDFEDDDDEGPSYHVYWRTISTEEVEAFSYYIEDWRDLVS